MMMPPSINNDIPTSVSLDKIEELASHRILRAIEILLATLCMVLALPIMIIIGILIRLDSPGPALFWQNRIGLDGKTFKFVKFRTLYCDARERFPELYAYKYTDEEIQTLIFKLRNDPRVTRIGRWLRSSTLDELPNFWNVLTGDMALVGPRPELPEMMRYYNTQEMMSKFSVRPGITGLSQVSGRGELSFLETAMYDIDYVKNRSLAMDIEILLKTLYSVFLRKGAF
jgi:lipopolysaccharide/colanic/teichoic acid biosynthesis glycosyltransferase